VAIGGFVGLGNSRQVGVFAKKFNFEQIFDFLEDCGETKKCFFVSGATEEFVCEGEGERERERERERDKRGGEFGRSGEKLA
jgi:hypothetical protein